MEDKFLYVLIERLLLNIYVKCEAQGSPSLYAPLDFRDIFSANRGGMICHIFFKFTPLWIMSDNGYSDTDFRKYDAGNLYQILATLSSF